MRISKSIRCSFHDLIVTKAEGKTGALYTWECENMSKKLKFVSTIGGRRENLPAKICLRSWFDRNKHIAPANQWESFEPNKTYDYEQKVAWGVHFTNEDDQFEHVGEHFNF